MQGGEWDPPPSIILNTFNTPCKKEGRGKLLERYWTSLDS